MHTHSVFYRVNNSLSKIYADCPLLVRLILLSWVYAATSQIIIPMPFNLVPFSVQPAPIFVATLLFGWEAVGAYVLYLAQGACGAPFFSGFQGGFVRLLGPTGGYLFGFFFGMMVLAATRMVVRRNLYAQVFALVAAWVISFVCGLIQLAFFVPSQNLLAAGLYPFIVGDFVVKLLLALGLWRSWSVK